MQDVKCFTGRWAKFQKVDVKKERSNIKSNWTTFNTIFHGTKNFLIMDSKLVCLSLLQICFLSYNMPLCIISGYFYLRKKQYFILVTFRCFVLPENQRVLAAGKNNKVVLMPCSRIDVRPCSYFWWCGYLHNPLVSFVTADEFSVKVTKATSRIALWWTHSLSFYFMNLSKLNELWPCYQKHVNQIALNHITL